MPSRSELRQILFNWIKNEISIPVILANQKAARPPRPYAVLNVFTSSAEMGGMDQQRTNSAGLVVTSGLRRLTASINVLGPNALDLVTKVRDSLDRPDIIELFELNGIAELDRGAVADLTELEETEYEERGQMDITIAYTSESSVNVGTIETVQIEGVANAIPVIVSN